MYDADTINAQIEVARATLKELDRIIKKVEGLDDVYKEAEALMEAAYQEVLEVSSRVASITPSSKYVYKR